MQKTKTNNSLLQKEKEVIKNSFLQLPSSISSPDNSTKQSCLTSQNKPTIHTLPNSQPLTNTHISDNCHLFATTDKMNSTKTSHNNIHANNDTIDFSHACENSNNNPLSPILTIATLDK